MPKLYEYKGWVFFFYSNDHLPEHCHVKKGEKEIKVFFENIGGVVLFDYELISTHNKLTTSELDTIAEFVTVYYNGILDKWDTFFNKKKKPKFEKINRI